MENFVGTLVIDSIDAGLAAFGFLKQQVVLNKLQLILSASCVPTSNSR
jgi:hypothetical protein